MQPSAPDSHTDASLLFRNRHLPKIFSHHSFTSPPSTFKLPDVAAIAEAVKVSKSFVHKTCKNPGPQPLEIPACHN